MDYVSQRCDKNELVKFESENIQNANLVYESLLRVCEERDDDDALLPNVQSTAVAKDGTSPIHDGSKFPDVNLEDIELNDDVLDYLVNAILRENDFETADSGDVPRSSGSSQITVTNDGEKTDQIDVGERKNDRSASPSPAPSYASSRDKYKKANDFVSIADRRTPTYSESLNDGRSPSYKPDSETNDNIGRIDLLATRRRPKIAKTKTMSSKTSTTSPCDQTSSSSLSTSKLKHQLDKHAATNRRPITASSKLKSTTPPSSSSQPTTNSNSAKYAAIKAKSKCETRSAANIARKSTPLNDYCKTSAESSTKTVGSSFAAVIGIPRKSASSSARRRIRTRDEFESKSVTAKENGDGAINSNSTRILRRDNRRSNATVSASKDGRKYQSNGEKRRPDNVPAANSRSTSNLPTTKSYDGDRISRDTATATRVLLKRKNIAVKSTTVKLSGKGDSQKIGGVESNFKSKGVKVESGVLRSKAR